MENKICVYAICKNENAYVRRWVDSMKEADYIVVLDTGSTDGTYEMLCSDKRIFRVEQKVISPWRFDVARNESLKLVPKEANILVCVDLDECFDPGWAEIIKDQWDEEIHTRGIYRYAWSHNSAGLPLRIFYYDKIHGRGWKWKYPVHEILISEGEIEENTVVFGDGVYLHHHQNRETPRSSYLPLLQLRVEENPKDYDGIVYLGYEYQYRQRWKESNQTFTRYLDMAAKESGNREAAHYSAAILCAMGNNCEQMGDRESALAYYLQAMIVDNTIREPYLLAAQVYNTLGQYHTAMGMIKDCLRNTYRHYSWIELGESWNSQPDDILSVAYYYTGDIRKSYRHALRAFELNPDDKRIAKNLKIISLKLCEEVRHGAKI